MVEIFFGVITRQAIRRGTFTSAKDLNGAIETFIDGWNERCEPFVWTKTAEDIIGTINRKRTPRDTSFFGSEGNGRSSAVAIFTSRATWRSRSVDVGYAAEGSGLTRAPTPP